MVVVVRHRKMFGCVDHKEPVHLKNKQTNKTKNIFTGISQREDGGMKAAGLMLW